jgi:hypothetical protein
MNDDFFIMNKVKNLPYMYSGALIDKINIRESYAPRDMYTTMLIQTYSDLYEKSKIKQPLDYELHVPMIFEKQKLSSVIDSQGLWRSMYGNIYGVGGKLFIDNKIYSKEYSFINNNVDFKSIYLSTEDNSFEDKKEWFDQKFPKPSKFENY